MRTLIYSKLGNGCGNTTSAERLAGFLRERGEVFLRGISPELPENAEARDREIGALRQMVIDHMIDLVIGIHAYRAGTMLQAAFGSKDSPAVPYLLIASGTDLNLDLQNIARHAAMRSAFAGAAGIVALSPEILEKATALCRESTPPLAPPPVYIPHAPDFATTSSYSLRAALGLVSTQSLILLPAGIRPVKGIALAIESMAQALLEHPDHVLAILGPTLDPDYHAHCASLIGEWRLRHRSLKGRMHLLDGLPRPDYLAALRESTLLLNTSEAEAISNAVLEAQGAGIPVLARDIAGNRAVITHEENGLLFDRLPAFLREYRRFFADPALRQRLIAAGRHRNRQHNDPVAEKTAYFALIDRSCNFRR